MDDFFPEFPIRGKRRQVAILKRESARPAILECAGHFDISVNVERTLAVLTHALKADVVSGKIRKT